MALLSLSLRDGIILAAVAIIFLYIWEKKTPKITRNGEALRFVTTYPMLIQSHILANILTAEQKTTEHTPIRRKWNHIPSTSPEALYMVSPL